MGTQAVPQPADEARAYAFLVQALKNPSLRASLCPTVTDAGKQCLAEAGFASLDQCGELVQILQWAAFSQANQ